MLSTFRIRDLRRPSTPPRPSLSGAARPDYDALVRITAPEYDTTISINPDAKLKYVDEDDGEVVTVRLEVTHCSFSVLIDLCRSVRHWNYPSDSMNRSCRLPAKVIGDEGPPLSHQKHLLARYIELRRCTTSSRLTVVETLSMYGERLKLRPPVPSNYKDLLH